jgi:hypothetical protein
MLYRIVWQFKNQVQANEPSAGEAYAVRRESAWMCWNVFASNPLFVAELYDSNGTKCSPEKGAANMGGGCRPFINTPEMD